MTVRNPVAITITMPSLGFTVIISDQVAHIILSEFSTEGIYRMQIREGTTDKQVSVKNHMTQRAG